MTTRIFTFALLLIITLPCLVAQPIVLEKGFRSKTFREGRNITVWVCYPSISEVVGAGLGQHLQVTGQLLRSTADSVLLMVWREEEVQPVIRQTETGAGVQHSISTFSVPVREAIPLDQVQAIMLSPRQNQVRLHRWATQGGNFLIMLGGATLFTGGWIRNESVQSITMLGAGELLLGSAIRLATTRSMYYLSPAMKKHSGRPTWVVRMEEEVE